RECPDWCIYIDSHKETVPPAKEGGRARTRNVLDRFAIDFSLCMYCGICVEVCPFDALWWSPEFEYSEYALDGLLHEMDQLRDWMDTVPPPPALDDGALPPAEVAEAIEKAKADETKAIEAAEAAEASTPAAEDGEGTARKPKAADVHVEGAGEIDQETYDQLIAEGKSERMARAKAKAAWVRKQKKQLREAQSVGEEDSTQAADGGADGAEAPAEDGGDAESKPKAADVHVEGAGEIDQ
ncbi:MAG: 4Fe-4S binding protein, partial [Nitriliruptoraceae bacterium]